MSNGVDEFVAELKGHMFEELKEAFGDIAYQRWQNPLHLGVMTNPDGYARLRGRCGDTIEMYLKFENDHVGEASFQVDGCGASMVCGSFAAEMAIGKTPDEILEVTGESIIDALGGFPKDEAHCAFLAAEALQEALHDYMGKERKDQPGEGGHTL
jgi:nitrogen fixation NifU-like protein